MAGALQHGGAHHHVAAGGGEAMEQHDRDTRASAGLLAGESHAVVEADRELARVVRHAGVQAYAATCARSSSADRSGRSQKNRCPMSSSSSRRAPGISPATMRPFCTGST